MSEEKPIPSPKKEEAEVVCEKDSAERRENFRSYILKPGLIGSVVCMVLWVLGASVASAFLSGPEATDWANVIHNVFHTIASISSALLWLLFLPALIIGIIFVCRRPRK